MVHTTIGIALVFTYIFGLFANTRFGLATIDTSILKVEFFDTRMFSFSPERPQRHHLLFSAPNSVTSVQFLFNQAPIGTAVDPIPSAFFESLTGDCPEANESWFSITTGIFSSEECANDESKCWYPSIGVYSVSFSLDSEITTDHIRLIEASYPPEYKCAAYLNDHIHFEPLFPYNNKLPVVQDKSYFLLNMYNFLVVAEVKITGPLHLFGCAYDYLRVQSSSDAGISQEIPNPKSTQNIVTFYMNCLKVLDIITSTYKYILVFDDNTRLTSETLSFEVCDAIPPHNFEITTKSLVVEYETTKSLTFCSSKPEWGNLCSKPSSTTVRYFVAFVPNNLSTTTSDILSFDISEIGEETCIDVDINSSLIGDTTVISLYANQERVIGMSSNSITVYICSVPHPVTLVSPANSDNYVSPSNTVFQLRTLTGYEMGYSSTIPDTRKVLLLLDKESDLLLSDSTYLEPTTVAGEFALYEPTLVLSHDLPTSTTYRYRVLTKTDKGQAFSQTFVFRTQSLICDNSQCNHGTCSISINAKGEESVLCSCDDGYYGDLCDKSSSDRFKLVFVILIIIFVILATIIIATVFIARCIMKKRKRRKARNNNELELI